MKFYRHFFGIVFLSLTFFSCETHYKFNLSTPKKVALGKEIKISLTEKNNNPIDKVAFILDGKKVTSTQNSLTIDSKKIGIGKHIITALVFYPGKTKKVNNSFEVLANKPPVVYVAKIINTYPHDKNAYTQGLEFYNGFLYETTGRKGQSSLRKVAYKTGEVLQKTDLENQYFGEGMTIFNNNVFWLTWQAKKGFIYDVKSFKKLGDFSYQQSKEGWGLTHNKTELIKSDGTNKIWFLDPETQKEKRNIQVYTNKYAIDNLNELEYVNGKIYANKWQQNALVIIDENTGAVTGVANLTSLKEEMQKTQNLRDQDDVLNGIAYNKENHHLFVTGKHWGKLFEIELIKK